MKFLNKFFHKKPNTDKLDKTMHVRDDIRELYNTQFSIIRGATHSYMDEIVERLKHIDTSAISRVFTFENSKTTDEYDELEKLLFNEFENSDVDLAMNYIMFKYVSSDVKIAHLRKVHNAIYHGIKEFNMGMHGLYIAFANNGPVIDVCIGDIAFANNEPVIDVCVGDIVRSAVNLIQTAIYIGELLNRCSNSLKESFFNSIGEDVTDLYYTMLVKNLLIIKTEECGNSYVMLEDGSDVLDKYYSVLESHLPKNINVALTELNNTGVHIMYGIELDSQMYKTEYVKMEEELQNFIHQFDIETFTRNITHVHNRLYSNLPFSLVHSLIHSMIVGSGKMQLLISTILNIDNRVDINTSPTNTEVVRFMVGDKVVGWDKILPLDTWAHNPQQTTNVGNIDGIIGGLILKYALTGQARDELTGMGVFLHIKDVYIETEERMNIASNFVLDTLFNASSIAIDGIINPLIDKVK